ncbi:hypothetical protein B0J14DRAFT_592126 [Halenospora varia]|nr:hypothetical protein B0J14DRAFT_592126 [Halenospora varia]
MLSKSHRKELSEESTVSNETDDIEDGGFVGFQLGLVEVFEGDDIEDPAQEDAWSNTGFAVVVKISLSGCAVGLYLVYDFYQEDVHSGNMSRNIKTDDLWGYLPNFEERFGSAKVVGAESFDRIEFGLPLEFSDVVRNEVNLVHVVVASNGTIIRGQVASQVSMPEKGLKRAVE